MQIKIEVLPPLMPNFARVKKNPVLKQEGFKPDEGFPIKDFTEEEAYEYSELMQHTFMEHWRALQKSKNI